MDPNNWKIAVPKQKQLSSTLRVSEELYKNYASNFEDGRHWKRSGNRHSSNIYFPSASLSQTCTMDEATPEKS